MKKVISFEELKVAIENAIIEIFFDETVPNSFQRGVLYNKLGSKMAKAAVYHDKTGCTSYHLGKHSLLISEQYLGIDAPRYVRHINAKAILAKVLNK